MPYYWFKRGGWEMAVDAVSLHDARQYIARHATGAVYQGEAQPPSWTTPSTATGMITPKREEIIHQAIERQHEQWEFDGRPGAWWDKPTGDES